MVNGIASLISLSDLSLLVYRNGIDFCVLILHAVISPNLWMSSSSFLVETLGSLGLVSCHLANRDSFTSSFPMWIPFISFTSPIAMARTSKTMLKSSGESGHPCPVPDLSGNSFSFSPLRMNVSCGFVIYGLYHVEVGSRYAHFLKGFYQKWVLDLDKGFFCVY
uniref:Uncharacterized protein n=1 Tax=Sus scrofa TaxID=9823 RepID=A0A8D1S555_PIG